MKIVIYVKPRQKTQMVQFIGNNLYGLKEYIIHVINAPVDGKCNAELIDVLSEYFKVSKSSIEISSGHRSRYKIVDILNII